ncbi:hypothetical protein KEP72_24705 [Escherichia coli]|nr:hypothetical protein [Escherichia coli]
MKYFRLVVLYASITIISFPLFAGGGFPWTPIAPSNCVIVKEKPITFTGNSNPQCEQAIRSGIATGISIFGTASYVPEPDTSHFYYVLHEGETATVTNLGIYGVIN